MQGNKFQYYILKGKEKEGEGYEGTLGKKRQVAQKSLGRNTKGGRAGGKNGSSLMMGNAKKKKRNKENQETASQVRREREAYTGGKNNLL